MKHGYPPGYSYKSSKPSINNTTKCTPPEDSSNTTQDSPITMSSLFPTITYNINKDMPCHFCHLAKHKRFPYPDSIVSLLKPLHADI